MIRGRSLFLPPIGGTCFGGPRGACFLLTSSLPLPLFFPFFFSPDRRPTTWSIGLSRRQEPRSCFSPFPFSFFAGYWPSGESMDQVVRPPVGMKAARGMCRGPLSSLPPFFLFLC